MPARRTGPPPVLPQRDWRCSNAWDLPLNPSKCSRCLLDHWCALSFSSKKTTLFLLSHGVCLEPSGSNGRSIGLQHRTQSESPLLINRSFSRLPPEGLVHLCCSLIRFSRICVFWLQPISGYENAELGATPISP